MKPTIGLMLFMGLIMTSLVNCGPGMHLAREVTDTALLTRAPATGLATVAGPTELQQETVIPVSSTQVITENQAIGGTQVQPPLGDESAGSVKLAKQDLAQRLGVSVDSVTVDAVIGQEFSTDAFNCRTSKERIAKEVTPPAVSGQSILLKALGNQYEYHANGQTVIYCRRLP